MMEHSLSCWNAILQLSLFRQHSAPFSTAKLSSDYKLNRDAASQSEFNPFDDDDDDDDDDPKPHDLVLLIENQSSVNVELPSHQELQG